MYQALLRASKKMKPAPANVCHRIFLNRARVSNPPDCPATRLRLGRRRDDATKRPNKGRTAVRASVEGSHLLSGFAKPSETMPRRARLFLATPRVSRTPFLPPPEWSNSAES